MTLRIGLVGTGDIGRIHAAALAKLRDVELVVAAGRNPQRAEKLAGEFAGRVCPSFEALLADASIAGVDVCVPNHLHAEFTIAALRAGKHVLCEKPMAMTLDDACLMHRAAEEARRHLMVAHVLRYWPEYALAREQLKHAALGTLRTLTARRLVPLLRAVRGEADWRHDAVRSGGAVLDLQIHDLDFLLWTFGMPARLSSRGVRSATGAYDHVFTWLEYEDGPLVSLEASFMLQGNPVTMDFRALGDEGSLEFAFREANFAMHDIHGAGESASGPAGPASLVRYAWGRPPEILATQPPDPIQPMFDAELADFVRLIQGEAGSVAPRPEESMAALRLALASAESCATHKVIELN